jgi:ADP-ribose pyrophosphatase YjhB (NUDIX family)
MASAVRWRPLQWLMHLGIQTVVPRHRIGVALVLLDEQGRVLLLNHVFHPHVPWGLPGGWLSRNEDPEACALRELKEETGLVARIGPILHFMWEEVPPHVNVAYLGYVEPGAVTLSAEILELGWFTVDSLPAPLLPFTRDAIAAALQLRSRQTA